MNFIIKDYYELLALHRALMEAKFTECPNDPVIAGSPLVADIMSQVVTVLKQKEIERGHLDKVESWDKFLEIDSTRREWRVAVVRAQESDRWLDWSLEEKRAFSRVLLSPFVVDDTMLKLFMQEVEQ